MLEREAGMYATYFMIERTGRGEGQAATGWTGGRQAATGWTGGRQQQFITTKNTIQYRLRKLLVTHSQG